MPADSLPAGEYQEQLLTGIQTLQGRLYKRTEQNATPTQYSAEQLLRATEKLQQLTQRHAETLLADAVCIQAQDIQANGAQLNAQLRGVLGGDDEPRLNETDMNTIELVGMLFEYMLNDDQLPDCVKAVLSHLHTPFLKIAFIDANFSSDKITQRDCCLI